MRYQQTEAKRIGLSRLLELADDPKAQAKARDLRAENARRVAAAS